MASVGCRPAGLHELLRDTGRADGARMVRAPSRRGRTSSGTPPGRGHSETHSLECSGFLADGIGGQRCHFLPPS